MKKNEKYNLNLENDVFNLVKKHKKIIYLQPDTDFSELTKKTKVIVTNKDTKKQLVKKLNKVIKMNLNEYKLKQCIVLEKTAEEYLENDFEGLIVSFLRYLNDEKIEIYNEDSLKFELGTFLRIILPDYDVNFEKNIKCFIQDKKTIKHEIDITIYPKKSKNNPNDNNTELIEPETTCAIELKFPSFKIEKENNKFINKYNNGTNKILKELETDLNFIKELVDNGFKNAWSFVLVPEISNPIYKFPENPKKTPSKIYYRFREFDDNGIKDNIHGITWLEWENKGKYYIKSGHKK